MGWFIANGFLLAIALLTAGYCWIAFTLLKLAGLHENEFIVTAAFILALVATYYTARWLHALLGKWV